MRNDIQKSLKSQFISWKTSDTGLGIKNIKKEQQNIFIIKITFSKSMLLYFPFLHTLGQKRKLRDNF